MSSSTFEVTDTENEVEKDLSFGLEACEENGIGLSAQVDGEVPKDHTYTKDPDGSEDEEENEKPEENEKNDSSPEKNRTNKNSKSPKAVKKGNSKTKNKKESPKKEASVSKRGKAKKDVLTEESNKSEDNGKSEEKNGTEDAPKTPKRGKKRKVEEKENVIDRSIVEEVQNINEGDSHIDASTESPVKKRNTGSDKTPKTKKQAKPKTPVVEDGDNNQSMPKGWIRKEVVRKSGKTAGHVDVYIYSPDGIKFRSRPDVAAYLTRTKSNLKLEDFNFSKKRTAEDTPVKAATAKKEKATAVKPKSTTEKKKILTPATPTKKGSKLVVKLNFSPKSKRGKNVKKTSVKPLKQSKSSVKKGKGSGSNTKASKKKTA